MSNAAHSIAVVCEAQADQQTGCDLADRVLVAEVDWLERDWLPHSRQWRGFRSDDTFLSLLHDVKRLAAKYNIKSHGFIEGQKAAPDAHLARKALRLLWASADPPDAVVILRDDDGDVRRKEGLKQARKDSKLDIPIILGIAHPKREAWVLAGFEPKGHDEDARLAQCQEELHFDPREAAASLTAKRDHETKSAKRVLRVLTAGDFDREAQCWRETDLDILERRGQNTGLAAYLEEVRTRLAPFFRKASRTD